MFQTKFAQKIKTHFVFGNFFFFSKIEPLMKIWKNTVERGRPQATIWRICYNYTLILCNTHCFSTATMVVRTRVSLTSYVPNNTTLTRQTSMLPLAAGLKTRKSSKRAAAEPRLRPRGHWDRQCSYYPH